MEQLCSNVVSKADRRRLACCSQSNGGVVFLKNVQIKGGKLVFFNDQATALTNLDGSARIPHRLPPIPSVVRRKNMPFNMPVEHKNYSFVNAKCKSYFNGTLHVTGRSTTQNLYHALNDNVLPLLSLVVLDAHLWPEWLLRERAQLVGFQPPPSKDQVPHLAALLDAAVPHIFSLAQAEGVCFGRVAWGGGVKVAYQHLLGAVRRQSSDLLRELILLKFDPPSPYEGDATSNRTTTATATATSLARRLAKKISKKRQKIPTSTSIPGEGSKAKTTAAPLTVLTDSGSDSGGERRPLRVVIYSRGSTGRGGRSIGNETGLRDHLESLGARALVCCDFKAVTLAQQLGYATHADVILGLHGAGLINNIIAPAGSITVELKTVYGYGLTLFAMSAEARGGYFVELNIKDHHVWGQPGLSSNRPIDEALMARITHALTTVIAHREQHLHLKLGSPYSTTTPPLPWLSGPALRTTLFEALSSPASSRAPSRTGDVVIYPYPYPYPLLKPGLDAAAVAASPPPPPEQLDYLLHILGPEVSQAAAQCASMPISAYWAHTKESNVLGKYCIACAPPSEEVG